MIRILAIIILMAATNVMAQQAENKEVLEYFAVIDADSMSKEQLFQNLNDFFAEKESCQFTADSSDYSLQAKCGFWLYRSNFLKSIDGNINFEIQVDVKDNKYRYLVNNICYYKYKRNRYSQYEMVKNSRQPIEKSKDNEIWLRHKSVIADQFEAILQELDIALKRKDNPYLTKKIMQQEW